MIRIVGLLTQTFVIGLITLAGVLYLSFSVAARFAQSPAEVAQHTLVFAIPVGATTADIGRDLQAAGLIRSDLLFRLLVDRRGLDGKLRQGQYLLREDMVLEDILTALESGAVAEQTITFPEGWRVEEMAERLGAQSHIEPDAFLAAARAEARTLVAEISALRSVPGDQSLEGYLFPDTYQIAPSTTAEDLVRRMLRRFDEVVGEDIRAAAAARGMTLHQAITLATIIEREAVLDDERPLISGVFHNRLDRGIPLQADPTAQYAIGQTTPGGRWWKPDLTGEDLRVPSSYNTYVTTGLPPGPIANPGLKSIQAAVNPATTEYLFFVARGDGAHAFAVTAEEHARNVRSYLR